jgi:signal peptidase I
MLTLGLLLGFILCTWLLAALLVNLMTRWVKSEKTTFLRAFGLVLLLLLISVPFAAGGIWLASEAPANDPGPVLLISLGSFLVQTVLNWFVIRWVMQTSLGKAIVIWFGSILAGAISVALAIFVIKPFVVEAFVVPSNNMSPTIIGWHEVGTCQHCKESLTIPVSLPGDGIPAHRDTIAICDHCWKTSVDIEPNPSARLMAPDRIMSNKLLAPRRWDIVVYRTPKDPKVKYVNRLVGLPGETVVIKEGAVWIDGVKQTPPEAIGLLPYSAIDPFDRPTAFASEENPLKLGADECCFLGDFPQRSRDSRYDGPVPWENIEGVLGLCYWPTARWKLWR